MEKSTHGKFHPEKSHPWKNPPMENGTYGIFHQWKISPMKIPPMENVTKKFLQNNIVFKVYMIANF